MDRCRLDTKVYILVSLLLAAYFSVTRVRLVMTWVIPDSKLSEFIRFLDSGNKYNCSYSHLVGGRKICLDQQYRPRKKQSLFYSCGSVLDFSFEDSAATLYGATVRAFDATLGEAQHRRRHAVGEIQFYPVGVVGCTEDRKYLNPKLNYSTLETLHGSLDQYGRIDYLRVDIDGLEWSVLEDINTYESIRLNAKQLSIQLHTKHVHRCKQNGQCEADYGRYKWILDALRQNGFHVFHYDVTRYCVAAYKVHCIDVAFVNTRFAKK